MRARISKQISTKQRGLRGTSHLPADLQEKARQRLSSIGFVLCPLILVALVVFVMTAPDTMRDVRVVSSILASSFLSLLVGLIAWKAPLSTPVVMRFGMIYQLALCFTTSMAATRHGLESGTYGQMTWTVALIILFPLVIPSTTRMVLIISLLSAATRPLALGLLHLMGDAEPAMTSYLLTLPHVLLAVALAVFGSRIIYKMTDAIASARAIGSYSLETLLGEGGMGEVWRARHAMLARPAALKLMRRDVFKSTSPEKAETVMARFEREAQVTASLRSPHTVELFDFGRTDEGTFYYAMELLDGFTMSELVRTAGPVPPARVIWFLEQVCHSLEEAHRAGLVHRDIKPANLMICRCGSDYDFVKVLDFGIVKVSPPAEKPLEGRHSKAGAIAGTPGYIAPEMYTGEPVDHLSDIYSLGCVAYLLLSGKKLFSPLFGEEAIAAHITETPYRPSRVLSSEHAERIPPELEQLVMDCLEKNKRDRPQSVEDIALGLREIKLDSPWSRTRAQQWWTENRPGSIVEDHRPTPLLAQQETTVVEGAKKVVPS